MNENIKKNIPKKEKEEIISIEKGLNDNDDDSLSEEEEKSENE